jgi:hypothetical protein
MGNVCPIVTAFCLIMNRGLLKNKLLHKKSFPKINKVRNPLNRIPIETLGLVQPSFIHNLI